MSNLEVNESLEQIAIIGMAGRFPGAKNLEEFWQNLKNGVESISFFSDEELIKSGISPQDLKNPNYVKAGGFLEDIDLFDASFFNFNPKEAEITDPQHRLFLECSWEALEKAGYNTQKYQGRIGVYGGASLNNYSSNYGLIGSAKSYQTLIANDKDFLTTRVSYKLNLTGPSITIQTACSTSLVAVVLACQSLLYYQSDLALAGGVSLRQKTGYVYEEGGTLSPDGHCRAFDAQAQGMVIGNGVGVVLLKRLSEAIADRDYIYAVIKGSAINNDGGDKVGYTAPSVTGQAEVINEAILIAGVKPETISYIETHGTGTKLGDPIEVAALSKVFTESTEKKNFCALGSVKTNIGHLDAAAGIAGLIKTVLALKHQLIPPSLHFEHPNPQIDFANSPFYVNTKLREWKTSSTPRRAGVSSLGIGGTNAHVILEEAPSIQSSWTTSKQTTKKSQLLVISAKTNSALPQMATNLASYLQQHPDSDLADVAYTLQVGRRGFPHRLILVSEDREDTIENLKHLNPQRILTHFADNQPRSVTFMFPGQGSQYVDMGKQLYHTEAVFRQWVDYCSELLKPQLSLDLRKLLYPDDREQKSATEKLKQTSLAQPALFVIEYALFQLWLSWGIIPQSVIGHSVGEYVAATIAGIMSVEDALGLIALRGKLLEQMPTGSMLAVSLSAPEVDRLLDQDLCLAAINAPSLSVISGTHEAIGKLAQRLTEEGVECRHLHTSHAFHSWMMDPVIEPLKKAVAKVQLNSPRIPIISNVTGTWMTAAQATDPNYWAKHLRETVRFSEGVSQILQESQGILLEVGPGRTLSTFVKNNTSHGGGQIVLSSLRHPQDHICDVNFILNILGRLWLAGLEINWFSFYNGEQPGRIPLPTYPFERQRYWLTPEKQNQFPTQPSNFGKKANIADWFYLPSWKKLPLGKNQTFTRETESLQRSCYVILINQDVFGSLLIQQLRQQGAEVIAVYIGDEFKQIDQYSYHIDPTNQENYNLLLDSISNLDLIPTTILHLWSISSNEKQSLLNFWSLLFLAQAIEKQKLDTKITMLVGTNSCYGVIGNEVLGYQQAVLLGACRVIPQEFSHINCRQIDVLGASYNLETLVEQLIAELTTESKEKVVAYRYNQRWVQTFESISLEKTHLEQSKLTSGGVYLITGGLGGIGLVLAEYLARKYQAKLILLSRTALPSKPEWQQWLATHNRENLISQKIKKILELEANGAQVLLLNADVTNQEEMEQAIAQSIKTFGVINGVIHGAGIAGGGMIQTKTPTIAEAVFAPKLTGTLILTNVLKDIKLDFLVLCSSLSSIVGGFGQADYCAANAFLDAFAHYYTAVKGQFTVAINWDVWQEVGMAVNTDVPENLKKWRSETLEKGLLSAEAMEVFERILANSFSQVIVSTQNLDQTIDYNNHLLNTIFADSQIQGHNLSCNNKHLQKFTSTNYVAPGNETEKFIANLWQEVLGLDQIGIYDNFFELGGHSLLAIQATSRLREAWSIELPLRTLLFEAPTIAQLASVIDQKLANTEQNQEMEELLTQIESLSEAELEKELAQHFQ